MNGSEPNDSSTLYSAPIKLNIGSYVIKAKAFKNNFESSETSVAQIDINESAEAPQISEHPISQSVYEGDKAVFKISATGTPKPEIQWMRNSIILPGEISDSLVLENVQLGDTGTYSARVSNIAGEVISNEAQLQVNSVTSINEKSFSGIPEDFELIGN